MTALRLQGATARYNDAAVLKEVSLTIPAGQRVALVGRSGAGKTTLLRLLHEQYRNTGALIPQDLGLVPTLSVFHNVYMGRLHIHPTWYNMVNLMRPLEREVAEVRPWLERLGLDDKLFAPVGELSGGQRQRTAVARALIQGSELVLGDEPVSAVDLPQAHNVLRAINDRTRTVVLAMHDVELALAYTDRVIGLQDGTVVVDRTTGSLSAQALAELY